MNAKKMMLAALVVVVPIVAPAQVTPTRTVPAQPTVNSNPNLKVDPRLKINPAAQQLTGGSRKRWGLTKINTNGYNSVAEGNSCFADNELILSNDQNANYSEGQKICGKSGQLSNLKWQLSADGKKLMIMGLLAMAQDNSNALVGFLLGGEAEILELIEATLRIRFKASDGYINGKLKEVTNEITYTAK